MFWQSFKQVIRAPLILLMGGPGSGKGSLANALPELAHVSVGERLRVLCDAGIHPRASYFKEQMLQGKLLEDKDIVDLLQQDGVFQRETPVLLDGFPRTTSQFSYFKEQFGTPFLVVHLHAEPDVLKARLKQRGREDDNELIIERRINEYLNNTKPLADDIARTYPNKLICYDTSSLSPEEISERFKPFLNQKLHSP